MIAGTQEGASSVELDRGPRAGERTRMCAVTREIRPLSELIRFVVGPDGAAVPDLKTKLPGRGSGSRPAGRRLGEAIKRKVFRPRVQAGRPAARGPRRADRTALLERAVSRCARDGRQGRVWSRPASPRRKRPWSMKRSLPSFMRRGAPADGVRKARGQSPRAAGRGYRPAEIGFLTTAQLDLALSRPNVVHAALLAGPASETFLARCRRLERFRTGDQQRSGRKGCAEVTPAGDMNAYD